MISKVIPQFPMRGLDSKAMSRDKEIVMYKLIPYWSESGKGLCLANSLGYMEF